MTSDPNQPNVLPLVDTARLVLLMKRHGVVVGLGLFVVHQGGHFSTLLGGIC